MATWIAHFRTAERILAHLPALHRCAFLVGNIAPDSGIPNDDRTVFSPPTEITHFLDGKVSADYQFFRSYMHPFKWNGLGEIETSFRLGYFCHLVCDNLWREIIVLPTRATYQKAFKADPSFIWTVKEDWYALDFEFVRSHPHSLFWSDVLSCPCPPITLDFLDPTGVLQRLNYIQTYYQRDDEEVNSMISQQRKYLHKHEMDAYVEQAAAALISIFPILKDPVDKIPAETISTLSLLGEENERLSQ